MVNTGRASGTSEGLSWGIIQGRGLQEYINVSG